MSTEYRVVVKKDVTRWYLPNTNILHRIGGPAVEYADGFKYYYQNGKLHRIDGPAIEHSNGSKFYYQNGKTHRIDGPAVETANGTKEYYINGNKLTEQEFFAQNNSCNNKVVEIDGKKFKLVEV